MPELTPTQIAVLERLAARGFSFVAFPLYASAIGVRRGEFAALLTPVEGGAMRLFGDACYLIEGNLAVRVTRKNGPMFVWKKREVEATPERLAELAKFSADVAELLLPAV
jgi:hypothetical protein